VREFDSYHRTKTKSENNEKGESTNTETNKENMTESSINKTDVNGNAIEKVSLGNSIENPIIIDETDVEDEVKNKEEECSELTLTEKETLRVSEKKEIGDSENRK